MITVVIIKEALCFYKFELFLSDDDSIAENEDMNNILMVLLSVIFRLQNTECYANSFHKLRGFFFYFIHIQRHIGGY